LYNKINPLTLLLVSIIIFLTSLIFLKQSNIDIKQLNHELVEFESLSSQYHALNSNWNIKKKKITELNNILSSSGIKNIVKEIKKKKVIIKFNENSINKIDKFINKILNGNFNILKLNVTKNSVNLEIGY